MRTAAVILVLSLLVGDAGTVCSEEPRLEDVVYLRNGSVIRGTIVEIRPDESVKIQMSDGSILVFPFAEVQRIAKEEVFSRTLSLQEPKKEAAVAFALSFVLPGAGQFYNGEYGKGAAMLACWVGGWIVYLTALPQDEVWCDAAGCYVEESGSREFAQAGAALAVMTWLFSFIEAPFSTVRINRARGYSMGGVPISDQSSVSFAIFNSRQRVPGVSVALRWQL